MSSTSKASKSSPNNYLLDLAPLLGDERLNGGVFLTSKNCLRLYWALSSFPQVMNYAWPVNFEASSANTFWLDDLNLKGDSTRLEYGWIFSESRYWKLGPKLTLHIAFMYTLTAA